MHFPVVDVCGDTYSLKKNIVYIFDEICFDKPINICISSPEDTHNYIKFQNCTFTCKISIDQAENVVFINNEITTYRTIFTVTNVKNLKFINDETLTNAIFSNNSYIDINCDTFEMYDTDICGSSPKISVKNLIMKNSSINGDEKIEINADKINLEESEIYSEFKIELNTKKCNDFSSIKTKNMKYRDIAYKGLSLRKHNNSCEEIDKLVAIRQSLVDTLATIKANEENYQKEEVSRYRKELKNSPLTRRLTKKNT